jgi:tetratricopeptide (TPR) repeat protein
MKPLYETRCMRRVAVLVVLLITGGARANEQAADAEAEMARADQYMADRNFQAAIAHYNAAKLLAPDRPGPYRGLGMALYAAGQCQEAVTALEAYVRIKSRDPWAQAVHALADCKARLATPPAATPPTPPAEDPAEQKRRLREEAEQRRRDDEAARAQEARQARERAERQQQLGEYEQSQAVEQTLSEQVRVLYERERINLCGSGADFKFCDVNAAITENDFIRRYKKLTGSRELDHALKMRNKVAIGVWAAFGFAGVGLMAYGLATLDHTCVAGDSNSACKIDPKTSMPPTSVRDSTSEDLAYIGGGVHLGASLIFLLYGGLKPDGVPTHHLITEYDARLYVEKYNRALQRRIRADLAAGRPTSQREPKRSGVHILPYIGAGGLGVVGSF